MGTAVSLSHTRCEWKYHLVKIPKYPWKALYGELRKHLIELLHELAYLKESKILEGHLQTDHMHVLLSILLMYSVAQLVGFMKGKSAIHITRSYLGRRKSFHGMQFWTHGAILFPRLGLMRQAFASTLEGRIKKTRVSFTSRFSMVNDHR
jgi:putative transposase